MLNRLNHTAPAASRLLALGLTICSVPLVIAAVSPTAAHAPECVAWWRFQGGVKGHPAADHQVIEDSSGHDQHGLAFGGPRFRRTDLPNSNLALAFQGGEQRVFVPDDELFQLTGSLTLEAYVEVDRYPGFASQIVFRGDERGGFDPWFLKITESGRLEFTVTDDRNQCSAVVSPAPLPLHTWLHVAGTLDDATGDQSLFVNGVRVAATRTAVRPFAVLGGADPGIGIGNIMRGSDQGFLGSIDEVRISAQALTADRLLPPPKGLPAAVPTLRASDR